MSSVCFYFQVHQPERLKRYRIFDIDKDHSYFNDAGESNLNNQKVLRKVAQKSYLPAASLLLELLRAYPEFKVSFSFSGIVLDQFANYAPEVLDTFQKLVETGRVEILSETYYHSLAFLYSPKEFRRQVRLHDKKIFELFGVRPRVFRNTELIYNNALAQEIKSLGFTGVLAEGADHILEWRSPNFLYEPEGASGLKLLLKNYKLSDDIAFRFGSRDWADFPLTAPKFARWVSATNGNGDVVNLFLDFETFGEHQWEDTGIFNFLRALPEEILKHPDNDFVTPGEAINRYPSRGTLSFPHPVSWADTERDISAWLSNPMQNDAMHKLYGLEREILRTGDNALVHDWRKLQTSDHFYYMCTKWFADGDVHKYFNPYETPYDAFITFMNVLNDVQLRVRNAPKQNILKRIALFFKDFALTH